MLGAGAFWSAYRSAYHSVCLWERDGRPPGLTRFPIPVVVTETGVAGALVPADLSTLDVATATTGMLVPAAHSITSAEAPQTLSVARVLLDAATVGAGIAVGPTGAGCLSARIAATAIRGGRRPVGAPHVAYMTMFAEPTLMFIVWPTLALSVLVGLSKATTA